MNLDCNCTLIQPEARCSLLPMSLSSIIFVRNWHEVSARVELSDSSKYILPLSLSSFEFKPFAPYYLGRMHLERRVYDRYFSQDSGPGFSRDRETGTTNISVSGVFFNLQIKE